MQSFQAKTNSDRQTRRHSSLRVLAALFGASFWLASGATQATLLDFNYVTQQIATNDSSGLGPLLPTGGTGWISQTYGDGSGLDVSYRYFNTNGLNTSSLQTWSTGYDELSFAAWYGNQGGGDKAQVELASVGGASVTLSSFRLGVWGSSAGRTETIKVYELGATDPFYEFTGLIGVGDQSSLFSFDNLVSTNGFLIEWTNPWWIAVSDINVSSVPVPSAVWLFGSALAGVVIRGRRRS